MAGFQATNFPTKGVCQRAPIRGLRTCHRWRFQGPAMLFDVIPGAAVWHWFVDNRCMKDFVMGHKVEVC